MSEVSSRTTVKAGSLSFTVLDNDPKPDGLTAQVMDGLAMTATLADLPWPMQETESASLSLWAPSSADLSGVVKGEPLSIVYATPRTAAAPVWGTSIDGTVAPARCFFSGKITDAVLRDRSDGVQLDLTALDHRSVDLATEVGDAPWPEETIEARLGRIFALLGLPFFVSPEMPLPGGGILDVSGAAGMGTLVRARDVDAQPALGLVTELLDWWAFDATTTLETIGHFVPAGSSAGFGRFVLRHDYDAAGNITYWVAEPRLSALVPDATVTMAGQFGATPEAGGGYGVTFPTDDASRAASLVPSGRVDLAAAYTQRPGQRPNRVTVSWDDAGAAATVSASSGGALATRFRLDTKLTSAGSASRAASLYLPDPGSSDWYADAFTWRWYADTAAQLTNLPGIGDLVTVAPIATRHTPDQRPYYSGILTGRTVQLARARPVVDLTITPIMRPLLGVAGSGLAWNDVPATVTWDDLNTRDTWDDYRLLRA